MLLTHNPQQAALLFSYEADRSQLLLLKNYFLLLFQKHRVCFLTQWFIEVRSQHRNYRELQGRNYRITGTDL